MKATHRWGSAAVSLVALVGASFVGGCTKPLTADQCEEISQKMGDVYMPNEDDAARTARHLAQRSGAGHKETIVACQKQTTKTQYDCMIAAKSPADVKACNL